MEYTDSNDVPDNTEPTATEPTAEPTATGETAEAGAGPVNQQAPAPTSAPSPVRRLYRTDGPIAGIAAGLAEYFKIDPILVRLALVAGTVVAFPVLPLVYIAAWIIIPKADQVPGPPIMTAPAIPPTPYPHPDAPAPADEGLGGN